MDDEALTLTDLPWDWDRAHEELGVTTDEFERALDAQHVELWHPRDVIVMSDDSDVWDFFREVRLRRPGRRVTIAWVPACAARDVRMVARGRLAVGVLRATA